MEVFLKTVVPKIVSPDVTLAFHVHQGKHDLLRKLGNRLRGYASWLPVEARIVVVVDRDQQDCRAVKAELEAAARAAGLRTRAMHRQCWQVLPRIAIEELEAWFFGEWASVGKAFARVAPGVDNRAAFRNCDAISGGTWEAFERVLQRGGYHRTGLRKVEAAQSIAAHFDPMLCRSRSFVALRDALFECTRTQPDAEPLT